MRRLPEIFSLVPVPERLRAIVSSAPLQVYAHNCWHGGLYKGERRAPILQTHGTDAFAQCLAFTLSNLVVQVAASGVREYDVIYDATAERHTLRLAALLANFLTENAVARIREDRESIGFESADPNFESTVESFRAVAQVMYPALAEMQHAFASIELDDRTKILGRAIDHALFITSERLSKPAKDKMEPLANTIDQTIEAFYPYFLVSLFGETIYERYSTDTSEGIAG